MTEGGRLVRKYFQCSPCHCFSNLEVPVHRLSISLKCRFSALRFGLGLQMLQFCQFQGVPMKPQLEAYGTGPPSSRAVEGAVGVGVEPPWYRSPGNLFWRLPALPAAALVHPSEGRLKGMELHCALSGASMWKTE